MQAGSSEPHTQLVFQVGTEKYIELCLVTFGLYNLFWTWALWRSIREQGQDINPVARTLFAVIFQFSLYRRISELASQEDISIRWKPVRLYLLFVPFTLIPAGLATTGHPWALFAFMLTIIPNLLVNLTINAINEKYLALYQQNTELTPMNWVALIGGLIAWLTILILAIASHFLL